MSDMKPITFSRALRAAHNLAATMNNINRRFERHRVSPKIMMDYCVHIAGYANEIGVYAKTAHKKFEDAKELYLVARFGYKEIDADFLMAAEAITKMKQEQGKEWYDSQRVDYGIERV